MKVLARLSDLRLREIVNATDGQRLGFLEDVEIDVDNGAVKGILVPGKNGFWKSVFRGDDIYVPWEHIKMIGTDVILVEVSTQPQRL
jgi:YlmC/YmxH family sporulation protein